MRAIIAMSIAWRARCSGLTEARATRSSRPTAKIETIWTRIIIVNVSAVIPTRRATQGLALID